MMGLGARSAGIKILQPKREVASKVEKEKKSG